MTEFVSLPGGRFLMGSDKFFPEEGPVYEAILRPFAIARYAVTNAEFGRFVQNTGYVTGAERRLNAREVGSAGDLSQEPGSLVFTPTHGPVDLRDWRQWWSLVPGASWRHPRGPESNIAGLLDHPVVQVSFEDATSYAAWAGARIPTEKEWEYAARGGLEEATYAWGEQPNEGVRTKTWQGSFPYENLGTRGWFYTAPVGSFPPNGFGLYEMTGNTWEWTTTPWTSRHRPTDSCCPQPSEIQLKSQVGLRVLKGGSHLCSPSYCLRYRPAARSQQAEDSATTHVGFRLIRDVAEGI